MDDWNWQQTLGWALMGAAIIMGCFGGFVFVFSFLEPLEAFFTLIGSLLAIGFILWKFGSRKKKKN